MIVLQVRAATCFNVAVILLLVSTRIHTEMQSGSPTWRIIILMAA
jgi:hypothetical protein